MILGNQRIKFLGEQVFKPFNPAMVQPSSYDLSLGTSFVRFEDGDTSKPIKVNGSGPFILHPNEFALATTMEGVNIPLQLCLQVDGKSTYGRLGLMVHVTAGFCDPGFEGEVTLELKNLTNSPITLTPGKPIAQAILLMVSGCTAGYGDECYNSHYQGQRGATEARTDEQTKEGV